MVNTFKGPRATASAMAKSFGVFVLGMHRSGTSTITHALQILGADLGSRLIAPAPDNPDGFFENQDVVAINDDLLEDLGHAWDDFRFLPDGWIDSGAAQRARNRIAVLYASTFSQQTRWAIKDPRLCLTFPLWRRAFEESGAEFGALLVVRDPTAVADSLRRRNGMGMSLGYALWLTYTRAACSASEGLGHAVLSLSEFNKTSQCIVDALRAMTDDHLVIQTNDDELGLAHKLDQLQRKPIQDELPPEWDAKIRNRLLEGNLDRAALKAMTDVVSKNIDASALAIDCSAYLSGERSRAMRNTRELLGALRSLQGERAKTKRESDELGAALIAANTSLDLLRRELAEIRAAHDRCETACVERDAAKQELKEIRAAYDQVMAEAKSVNIELTDRLERALHDCSLNFIAARTLEEKGSELLQRYNQIIDSHSWKVTKPFRFARRTSSAVFKGNFSSVWNELTGEILHQNRGESLRKRIVRKILHYADSRQNMVALNGLLETRTFATHGIINGAMGESRPAFDLSIVTHNSSKWLDNYFRSLIACGYPLAKIHVHVVDNGSNDETLERLRLIQLATQELFASFDVIPEKNRGFGAGHDVNFSHCVNDFVLVSNVDLEFIEGSLAKLLAHAIADDESQFAAWEMCQAPYEHPKHYDPVSWVTNWQAYACVLIRRAAYKKVGGFDKRIFMYCEDVELSYRFRSFGWRLMYCPDCVVIHHSYDSEACLFKPLQFFLGTLGAGYVRMRYGTWSDRAAGILLHVWLMLRREQPLPRSRHVLAANFIKLLRDAPHFLRGKGRCKVAFPFRNFDFELTRAGATLAQFPLRRPSATISIITRTHSTKYRDVLLRQAGISVGKQRYEKIEWIVVQDGGNELKYVTDEIAALYPHLKIRFIPSNKLGRSHAGNIGLSKASGEYCMFLDDDDLLYADHCETLADCLLNNETFSAAYSLAFEIPTDFVNGHIIEGCYTSHVTHNQEWVYEVLQRYNFIPIQAVLFRRKLFIERGGFNVKLDQLEDWNLWLRYGYNNKFKFIPKTTSLYRVPMNVEKMAARQQLLHAAYDVAKADAQERVRLLSKS